MSELKSGITCVDNVSARGRKSRENRLPRRKEDIKTIVDSQSQTDPSFKSNRLYPRLTAKQVREQLIILNIFRFLVVLAIACDFSDRLK